MTLELIFQACFFFILGAYVFMESKPFPRIKRDPLADLYIEEVPVIPSRLIVELAKIPDIREPGSIGQETSEVIDGKLHLRYTDLHVYRLSKEPTEVIEARPS